MSNDIPALLEALKLRAEDLCFSLLPNGHIVSGEFVAKSGDTGFGAISVVLRGSKTGLVGFWAGRPDNPAKDGGDLLHLIMAAQRINLREAIKWAQEWLGGAFHQPREMPIAPKRQEKEVSLWKIHRAQALFNEATPQLKGTLAEVYFSSRGILLPLCDLSSDIRFLKRAEWWRGAKKDEKGRRIPGATFPAIVCAIRDKKGEQRAVHVTFLKSDGTGKAPVESPKLMMGDVRGGTICIQTGEKGNPRILLEGVEDGATAAMAADREWQIHAVTSLSNLKNAPIPEDCPALILVRDKDWGNEAAREAFIRAEQVLKKICPKIVTIEALGQANDLNEMVAP